MALSGCGIFGGDDEILPGERLPVRPDDVTQQLDTPPPLVLPVAVSVSDWTHPNATPSRMAPHAALTSGLTGGLTQVWRVDVGAGNAGRALLTSGPVIAEGRVFVIDAAATVHAVSTAGSRLWQTYVGREGEDGRDGFGGGVAVDGDKVFVTTGFGEVLALRATTGEILWRVTVGGPVRAAPVAADGRVIFVTRDDRAFALSAETGAVIWRIQGAVGTTGLLGGASPAVDNVVAILPFASGEVTAAVAFSGRRLWSSALSGGRRGLARSDIGDITGDPVIDGEVIYVANQSGRLVSIDRRTGQRNWTVNDGTINPVLPAGGSLFVITDKAELLRLDAATGARIWAMPLPEFTDPENREGAIGYGGPLLAGERLILTSTEGELLRFDPETGRALEPIDLPAGSYLAPAISGGQMVILLSDGSLVALQ
ncbi:MAG: PQQ-binding-like beta-propeller repeat protein [Pseudomonadota bacterium]